MRKLVRALISNGLLPLDAGERRKMFEMDPYRLRALCAHRRATLHELGRVLCHIAKRANARDVFCKEPPDNYPSWGSFLWSRHKGPARSRLPVRNRLGRSEIDALSRLPGKTANMEEFDRMWQVQQKFHNQFLSECLKNEISGLIFAAAPGQPFHSNNRGDPVVRVAINQFSKLARAMVREFGNPDLVVIENCHSFHPDKKTSGDPTFEQTEPASVYTASASVKRRLRIFDRQQSGSANQIYCPYTGMAITSETALSQAIEIDHIIPISRGGGNSPSNMVLCDADANRFKADRTPFEAFGETAAWSGILTRATMFPADICNNIVSERPAYGQIKTGFQPRQLHELRQIAKRAVKAARWICDCENIVTVDSATVAKIRKSMGLSRILADSPQIPCGSKNRLDHRHHAIDAISAALSQMPRETAAHQRTLTELSRRLIEQMIISVKPERGRTGIMHEETVYGSADRHCFKGNATYRKQLCDLSAKELNLVRDLHLRGQLQKIASGLRGEHLRRVLRRFSHSTGLRRVRLVRALADGVLIGTEQKGSRIVRPSGIHHIDIVSAPDQTWVAFGASNHAIRQVGWRPSWEKAGSGYKLVMRLHKSDMIELEGENGSRVVRRVARLAPSSGHVYLADPNAAGSLAARHASPADPFRWDIASAESLRKRRARALRVDLLGRRTYRKSNVVR